MEDISELDEKLLQEPQTLSAFEKLQQARRERNMRKTGKEESSESDEEANPVPTDSAGSGECPPKDEQDRSATLSEPH
jgi:hypothetical protein